MASSKHRGVGFRDLPPFSGLSAFSVPRVTHYCSSLGSETAYLLLYVDDIILTANSQLLLQRIIAAICHEFAMSDLGPLQQFLGIHVTRTANGLFLSQHQYCRDPKNHYNCSQHLEHIVHLKIPIIKKLACYL
jgi:hypothetical protein